MKLVELHVEGYGILREVHLGRSDLQAGLTVVFGQNEAGKSTLLSFIRAVLFGFKLRGEPVPEALNGGRLGGHLLFEDHQGGAYRIERTAGGRKGRLRLTLPDGTDGDEALLTGRVLQGLSYAVYKNVFAFGMEELRRMEDLRQDDIEAYIYGAGTGIEPQRLTAAVNRLRSEMDGLFTPGGRTGPELNRLSGEMSKLETGLRRLREMPDRYLELKEQLAGALTRREVLQDSRNEVLERINLLEKLVQARESWEKLNAARAALAELPEVASFPESGVRRLEALDEKVHDKRVARAGYVEAIETGEREMERLCPDPALLSRAADIGELAEQRPLLSDWIAKAGEAADQARQSTVECAGEIGRLGPGWTEDRLLRLDTSIVVRQQVEGFRTKLEEAHAREKQRLDEERRREEEAANLTRLRDEAQTELDTHHVPESPVDTPLEVREQMLDRLEVDTRLFRELQTELTHLNERKTDLTERMQALGRDAQGLSPILPVGATPLALVFVLAVAGAGLALEPLTAVPAVVIGVPAVVVLEIFQRRAADRQNRAKEHLDLEHRELQSRLLETGQLIAKNETQAAVVAESVREAARAALGTDSAGEEAIKAGRRALGTERRALERRKMLAESLAGAEAELDRANRLLGETRKALDDARRHRSEVVAEWDAWLERSGFDPGLEPPVLLAFIEAADKARELIKTRDTRRRSAESLRRRVDDLVGQADELAKALGFPPVDRENADHRLQTMRQAADEALERERQRLQLAKEAERLQALVRACDREIEMREQEIAALLGAAGAADREDFRRRSALFDQRCGLQEVVSACERELSLLAGSAEERDRLDEELSASGPEEHAAQLEQARERSRDLELEREQADQEIGRLNEQIAVMEAGDQLAAALQEREMLHARIYRQAGEWQVRALALRLLQMAKEKYERERQPAVLARASEYLRPMTSDRYRRVIAPVGQADKLEVERGDGTRLGAGELSRGTAAQLFLSVRLALARQLAETSAAGLPLILDDILVDFDRDRLGGAARVLGAVAAEQQVILFTCHQHILETVTRTCPNADAVHL